MKNKFLESLIRGIDAAGNVGDIKFRYALAKNRKKLIEEISSMNEMLKPSTEFNEYDRERMDLAAKMANKDKNGKPIVENDAYVFSDKSKFKKEFEKLKKENKKVLDEREKQIKEFNDFLDMESTFEPHKIKQEDLPKNPDGSPMLSAVQISEIIDLIEM